MIRSVHIAALLIATGCQSREAPPPTPTPTPMPVPTPTRALDAAPSPDADTTAVRQVMQAHFTLAVDVQRAITRGHLDAARESARALIAYDAPDIEGGAPFVADMKQAATALVAAKDLPSAGTLAAVLGRTCSRCHEATNAVIAFAWEPQPDPDPSLRIQMQRHQWAAARLWEGVVGPSDEMWNQGVDALAAADIDALVAARGVDRGDTKALAKHVHELAARAKQTTDPGARAQLYGDLLSTCAGCHQLLRPAPVPDP